MKITQLEKMEKIVAKNKSLFWDGWDVFHAYPSDKGITSKYGAFINGKWHITRKFKLSSDGWDLPDKFVS
jgi:hypothetical protein